ncbi:MAG TPA: IS701 family transposase [Oscillatoriaceae cyanobacterium M33_DOE_052]|uniref:IS701 family transposase n=1 Tax=Planktothricoides sp. SpSt-374 TaxID=2282167 RepID=A0A7C3VHE5_9CYAN|nr:IS701 family transposase [Oscillatoriaceae cyanobacterium M33_DOE_052]
MRETTPSAMPPCFERWCQKFDRCFKTKAQKAGFRHYLGGLLGESERKNITQMAKNTVGVEYNRLHHYITGASWSDEEVNEQRLALMAECGQTRISGGFSLIVDDTGHRKSGNFTNGVGRQYIGEIGKTDNGVVSVTTHLWDGKKSLPLDVALYHKADTLPEGKKDKDFFKKTELALRLIDVTCERGYRPGVVLVDAGYGNNGQFIQGLEERHLTYIGGVAKNRQVRWLKESGMCESLSLEQVASSWPAAFFERITLELDQPKQVWVAVFSATLTRMPLKMKTFAIVMNAASYESATEIDYLMTNAPETVATADWFVRTYSGRNWVEVFYREVKGWLGWREYQVRDKRSLMRHFTLVFCAYTFILWQKLTGGLRRRWATQKLNTFAAALSAWRNAVSFRFVRWLTQNLDVFAAYKASFGLVWA